MHQETQRAEQEHNREELDGFVSGVSRREGLQLQHAQRCQNFMSDLVHVVQKGPSVNTFHWQDVADGNGGTNTGMLTSLRMLLIAKYGRQHVDEHLQLLDQLERIGNPRVWAFMWILFSTTDVGLQTYVAGVNDIWEPPPQGQLSGVENYVGTDGQRKRPVDAWALQNYLRGVCKALREYVWGGMRAEQKRELYFAVTNIWMYGAGTLR